MNKVKYFQCPYCEVWEVEGNVRCPKTIGKYRVKIIDGTNVLIFQCQRCSKVFRVAIMGKPLLWDDLTQQEKKAFKTQKWVKEGIKKWKKNNQMKK